MNKKPILLITGEPAHSPFAHYMPEILLTEGYLCYDSFDLRQSELSERALEGVSIVLLGDVQVSEQTMGLLSEFVRGGGSLIAMRPQHNLEDLFGLKPLEGIYSQAADVYLSVELSHPWMESFPAQCFQFHGDADIYQPQEGKALVFLAGQPHEACSYPAVWVRQVGQGFAVAFAFDLAASVALTHQGIPREKAYDANPDRDRDGMFKPTDFFVGYLDYKFRLLPQADLQQEILVRILRYANLLPIPRIWYFPSPSGSAAVIRGDSDEMTRSDFDRTLAIAEEFDARYTIQLMEEHLHLLSRRDVESLRENGHDAGIHPIFPVKPTVSEAIEIVDRLVERFNERYGFPPTSYTAHSHIFPGWVDIPKHMARRGIALNTDFSTGRYVREGYINGSGLPGRFIDEAGELINVIQLATLQSDDAYLGNKLLLAPMDSSQVISLTQRIIQDCLRFNTVYHSCCHPANVVRHTRAEQFMRAILEAFQRLSIPTFGGYQWAEFNRRRRNLNVAVEDLNAGRLRLRIEGMRELPRLTVVLPRVGQVRRDDQLIPTTSLTARGQEWFAIPLSPDGRDGVELQFSP